MAAGVLTKLRKHSLAYLLAFVEFLALMSHMMLINLATPANTEFFFNYIFDLISFDIVPTNWVYDKIFKNDNVPLTVKFATLGYESKLIAPNLGFLFIYTFAIQPLIILITYITYKIASSR